MSVNTSVTRQFDNGTVQVDVTSKNMRPRYFQVPKQNAAAFCDNFKKQDKRNSIITNTAFALSTLGGVIITSLFTKNIKKTVLKYIINTLGGIAGASASVYFGADYISNKQTELLKKYQAKEIHYDV